LPWCRTVIMSVRFTIRDRPWLGGQPGTGENHNGHGCNGPQAGKHYNGAGWIRFLSRQYGEELYKRLIAA
jgi:hypothetical protein